MRPDPHDLEEPHSLDQLFFQTSKLHRDLSHASLAALGLHRGQPMLLFALLDQDGQTHSQLAEALMVTPATISRMVQRMERAGFVTRRPDAADERLSRVYLTPAGRNIDAALRDLWSHVEAVTFAGLDASERAALYRYLLTMRGNLARAVGREAPAEPAEPVAGCEAPAEHATDR